jgi:hypothetical protein
MVEVKDLHSGMLLRWLLGQRERCPSAPLDWPRLRDRQGPTGLRRLLRRLGCRPHLSDSGRLCGSLKD